MRIRLGAVAFAFVVLAILANGCRFAGVAAVYMAIDSQGAQRRTIFYTDTSNIYCVAIFSSGKKDATVDYQVNQLSSGVNGAPPLHAIFSVGEIVPGPSTDAPVAYQVPPQGITETIQCSGECLQNGVGCPAGFTDQGPDSCGVGATCCFNPFVMGTSPPSVIPFPTGTYECVVSVDGKVVGKTPFTITYPPPDADGMTCPVVPPVNGVICADWVPQGAKCLGFNSNETCTCKGAAWSCK